MRHMTHRNRLPQLMTASDHNRRAPRVPSPSLCRLFSDKLPQILLLL